MSRQVSEQKAQPSTRGEYEVARLSTAMAYHVSTSYGCAVPLLSSQAVRGAYVVDAKLTLTVTITLTLTLALTLR